MLESEDQLETTPSYLRLYQDGTLQERIIEAFDRLEACDLCPRNCGVNRLAGEEGYCKTGRRARIASAAPHFGEEAPLVGRRGSGTIFVSSCNLLCTFCQNFDISHYNQGDFVNSSHLASLMVSLVDQGCHNINFVTPTHVVPQILEALPIAIERGLKIPLVYNTGGYDNVSTLELLEGVFDIYMPDMKFWEERWSDVYCNAPDYRDRASEALKEMHRQVGDLVIDDWGIATRGLLVRHLVMPNDVSGTREVMEFLAKEISPETYVNVMAQFWPCFVGGADPKINRRISNQEFRQAVQWAKEAGLKRLDKGL
jgi:putative pyruvate formate lyase activating enzyme